MTSKLKCSFCGEELDTKNYYVHCHNPHCNTTTEMEGTEDMWQALMQAKQDLEIALTAIKEIAEECGCLMAALKSTGFESVVETFDKNIRKKLKQIDHIADASKMVGQN